ncbi:MAG: hypothetical protein BAJALOKI3v1_1240005 [Promethearchaeota archaeon]|nr:MAG: hypothetical protein BAJALOKI3v1_1240005 [Candidatus Lokiarchaeota archaeon]
MAGRWVSGETTSLQFSTPVDRISLTWDSQTSHSPGTLCARLFQQKILNKTGEIG